MNQAQTTFEKRPGDGWLFWRRNVDDGRPHIVQGQTVQHSVALWDGHLTFPGHKSVQLRAQASTKARKWTITMHRYPEDAQPGEAPWAKLGEFQLNTFGGFTYVEGTVSKDGVEFKVRMMKIDGPDLRLRLPQVYRNTEAAQAAQY